jgi:hypothetical protein
MKFTVLIFSLFSLVAYGQNTELEYLKNNRTDLLSDSNLEIENTGIIGFGALHGSAKTEDAELILLKNLIANNQISYYLPETDFSTANYFQTYLETGDEELLKDLIIQYGKRVPQEASVEMFTKWKRLRELFKGHDIKILGIDKLASYKYTVKEISNLFSTDVKWPLLDSIKQLTSKPNANYSAYYDSETKNLLRKFVADYEANTPEYFFFLRDTLKFNHIIRNVKATFINGSRETQMYQNFNFFHSEYNLQNEKLFLRMGVYHLMKGKINGRSPLFAQLIENKNYTSKQVTTIQVYLTKSDVLWDVKLDDNGNYKGYSTKAGYGISDYWLEHYKGIQYLKKTGLSNITLYDLRNTNSPYSVSDDFSLLETKMLLSKSPWTFISGFSTVHYIDIAVLISHSPANKPVEELKL